MPALKNRDFLSFHGANPGIVLALVCLISQLAIAGESENSVLVDAFLGPLLEPTSTLELDLVTNLNARDIARRRPDKPRLGGYSDLPIGSFPTSDEIADWESGYLAEEIGAIVTLPCTGCVDGMATTEFLERWLETGPADRIFITYPRESSALASELVSVLNNIGNAAIDVLDKPVALSGELYATAGRRLGIDSREARAIRSDVPEIAFLGERVRRNSNSIFRQTDRRRGSGVTSNEPAVFLKESLGDEFTQSTIREIVVPGGVALGETARLKLDVASVVFDGQSLLLVDQEMNLWHLPPQDTPTVKSLFDFVERSDQIRSDAIVDIDGDGRVRMTAPLRNTDAGYEIMHADTQPFEFVRNLDVTKSVIIDTFVKWSQAGENQLEFESEYEVRFLSADNMRIAQTRAALVYEYDSLTKTSAFRNAWGKYSPRLNENLDTTGLGNSLKSVADYSGWVALLRWLKENDVVFLKGRYQFMKIDSRGKTTPARY